MGKRNDTYVPPEASARERDHQLAQEALQGNQEAWSALYQGAFAYVINMVMRFDCQQFFCACDYYDVVDKAFAKCYAHLYRYQGLSRFRRWVLGYAKNIMRNRRRAQLTAQRNEYLLKSIAMSQYCHWDPLRILIRLERDQNLWTAFHQLSALEREIVYWRVFHNTPPRMLAKEFQLTRKQVLTYYDDSLCKLRWNFCRLYQSV